MSQYVACVDSYGEYPSRLTHSRQKTRLAEPLTTAAVSIIFNEDNWKFNTSLFSKIWWCGKHQLVCFKPGAMNITDRAAVDRQRRSLSWWWRNGGLGSNELCDLYVQLSGNILCIKLIIVHKPCCFCLKTYIFKKGTSILYMGPFSVKVVS